MDTGGNRSNLEVEVVQVDQNARSAGSWLCFAPCYWLRRNNSVHKASLTVTTLLVTALLVASPVLFLISSVPGEKNKECHFQGEECHPESTTDVCNEEQCKLAASSLLSSMSWKTDPCQDFYQFACGSWVAKTKWDDDHYEKESSDPALSFNTLQKNVDKEIQQLLAGTANLGPFQKLGLFYKSCLRAGDKKVSLLPMFNLLEELGGYLPPNAQVPDDLTTIITKLLRINGAPLFDVYLDRDVKRMSKLALYVDLPKRIGHGIQLWNYDTYQDMLESWLSINNKMKLKRNAYNRSKINESEMNRAYAYMKASAEEKRLLVMEKIIQNFMPDTLTTDVKMKETHSTLLFASALTKLYPREKEIIHRNQQYGSYSTYNLTSLRQNLPFINWPMLLDHVFSTQVTQSDIIYVTAPSYMKKLQNLVPHFSSRVVHNALLLIYATDTLFELVNTTAKHDWPEFCSRITVNVFSKAVSALYVRQYTPEYLDQLNIRVTHIFERLKKTLESRMRTVTWLDIKTRTAALRKLSALHGQFLTWPHLWNTTFVESLLEDVRVEPDDFFNNVIRRYRQLRVFPVDFHTQTSDERRWAYPFIMNAFYDFTLNTIIIPLAVLTQPYFRADVPRYISYATMGLIFAHEILHGFDLIGIQFDEFGETSDWFSPESRLKLEARLDCVARQYSSTFWKKVNFLGSNVDIQFDWNVTRNENMADISGLQITYQAWRSLSGAVKDSRLPGVNLNAPQLFFLNAAQTYCSILSPEDYILLVEMDFHTPYPERVNGIMMNSPGFAEAFKCPPGSPMNPRKKCSTW